MAASNIFIINTITIFHKIKTTSFPMGSPVLLSRLEASQEITDPNLCLALGTVWLTQSKYDGINIS